MDPNRLVLVQGVRDTRACFARWNADPAAVLRPWALGAFAIATALLLSVWAIAAISPADPTMTLLPGLNLPADGAALTHILIRNSLVLVVQIEELRSEGKDGWTAVIEATEHRMRPILLTAAAASLALIPIAREVFWGPMAYAMMGGIIVGTVLTLLFLPALYVTWFRIEAPANPQAQPADAKTQTTG